MEDRTTELNKAAGESRQTNIPSLRGVLGRYNAANLDTLTTESGYPLTRVRDLLATLLKQGSVEMLRPAHGKNSKDHLSSERLRRLKYYRLRRESDRMFLWEVAVGKASGCRN